MNKKLVVTTVSIVLISVGALALNVRPSQDRKPVPQMQTSASAVTITTQTPKPANAPEHIVYRMFFHHLMSLKDRAMEVERKGGNGRGLRSYYEDRAQLNQEQAQTLDVIAADCEREVALLDARAKIIIDAYRVRAAARKSLNGGTLPPLPPELESLQHQRDMSILHHREQLRRALGAQGFKQLDDFVKLDAARNSKPAQLKSAM